mgnify:CR=1 FL=1
MEEYKLDGLTIKEHLLHLAGQGNKSFAESLNPGVEHVLGIRVPDLRKLALRIAKDDWEVYLDSADTYYMEERMLQGMVIGCIRPDDDIEVYLHRVTCFVSIINSWSVCDTFKFGGGKKFVEANKRQLWEYLKTWMCADKEYEIRFGVVMAMRYFLEEAYLPEFLQLCDKIHHEGYYVKMAVAWALSVYFIKYQDKVMPYLDNNNLDNFTYNKTLQKIIESYRVDNDTKKILRDMKRK